MACFSTCLSTSTILQCRFGSTMTQLEQESLKRFTHDVEVLYSLLDTNKDGYLDVEEMKNKFGEYQ